MKIYIVWYNYDNGEDYEDNYTSKHIEIISTTRQKALEYIVALSGEKDITSDDDGNWEEVILPSEFLRNAIRVFRREHSYDDEYEFVWYTITEHEVSD